MISWVLPHHSQDFGIICLSVYQSEHLFEWQTHTEKEGEEEEERGLSTGSLLKALQHWVRPDTGSGNSRSPVLVVGPES